MNILQINTLDVRGGAAKVAWSLGNFLERANNKVDFFVKKKYSQQNNVQEIFPTAFRRTCSKFLANDISYFSAKNIFNSEEFRQADIIHCHNLHGGYFRLKSVIEISKNKPVVWTLHDMWSITGHCAHAFDCEKWQTGCAKCPEIKRVQPLMWDNSSKLWQLKEKIYEQSRLNIVVPSLWLKHKIEKSILGKQPCELIYNGIDTKIFQKQDKQQARQQLNLPLDKKIVLFVADHGKENSWKGGQYIDQVIGHYKNNNKVLFVCIGGNKDLTESNVNYVSYIKQEKELTKYYSAADIFLFTSLAENFPLVILEAMSCGLPIVSFDVGGVKEAVIHKQNGYVSEYKNIQELIAGLEFIFSFTSEQLTQMSNNCIERVNQNFSLEIMTREYLELYKKVKNIKVLQRLFSYFYSFFAFRNERKLFKNKKIKFKIVDKKSIIHFSINKAATQYVKSILRKIALENKLIHLKLNEYAFNSDMPYLNLLDEEQIQSYQYLFKPLGFLYSVFGGMIKKIENLSQYKIILFIRDPRDILVSSYYSLAFSHSAPKKKAAKREIFLSERRKAQNSTIDQFVLSKKDLLYDIFNQYITLLTEKYDNVYITKYEDMIENFEKWFNDLLIYLEMPISSQLKNEIILNHNQRKPKAENKYNHVRKGVHGDYLEKLQPVTIETLNSKFSEILKKFNY